jgi:hypothetical protein
LIQLCVVEACLTKGITARGDKKNYSAETLFPSGRTQKLDKLDGFVWHLVAQTSVCAESKQ